MDSSPYVQMNEQAMIERREQIKWRGNYKSPSVFPSFIVTSLLLNATQSYND